MLAGAVIDDRPRPNPVCLHTALRRLGETLEGLHLEQQRYLACLTKERYGAEQSTWN